MNIHRRLVWSSSFSKKGKVLKLTNMMFIFNFSLWTFNRSRKDAFCPCSIFICISEQNKLFSICGKPSGSWACSNQKIDYKLQKNETFIFLQGMFSGKGSPDINVNAFGAREFELHTVTTHKLSHRELSHFVLIFTWKWFYRLFDNSLKKRP